jgi:hypothetical protein
MTLRGLFERLGIDIAGKTISVAGVPVTSEGDVSMAYKATPRKNTGMSRGLAESGERLDFVEVHLNDGHEIGKFKIISDTPTESPITTKDGQAVYWQRIRTLLLEGDVIVYGCAECNYVDKSPASIRPHLNRHKQRAPKIEGDFVTGVLDIVHRADAAERKIEKLTAERDDWKRRALKAEGDLTVLQRVFSK